MTLLRAEFDRDDVLWGNRYKLIEETIVGHRRWGVDYRRIIQDTAGDFWAIEYERPATEYQEADDGPLYGYRVVPKLVQTTVYEELKNG